MVIKIVCGWCGKPMGQKDGRGQTGTSHSMCESCAEDVRREIREAAPLPQECPT